VDLLFYTIEACIKIIASTKIFKALHGCRSIVPEFMTLVDKGKQILIQIDTGEFKEACGALSIFIR